MLLSRRGLITGLVSLVAAPAIVRASSLMPVKAWTLIEPLPFDPRLLEIHQWLEKAKVQIMDALVNPPIVVDSNGTILGDLPVSDVIFKMVFEDRGRRIEV